MVTHLKVRAAATALTVALALPAFAQTGSQSTPSTGGSSLPFVGTESQSMQGGKQSSAERIQNIEALSNAKGTVQIEGRVSDVDAENNQFTIADDTGDIDVKLQGNVNIREGDRVQVTGMVQEHTFGNNLQAERVELLNPRGDEAREKTLYDQQQQKQQQSQ